MTDISLATQTMFAELIERCLDAEFDERYAERGHFLRRSKAGREYWYYRRREHGGHHEEYVGPVADTAVSERVERFADIKSDFNERREMVRALKAARLPAPDRTTGDVVGAMWKAGFFRQRGTLIGTVAYQAYAGLLGVRLSGAALMTQDADFAQFWGVSQHVNDAMPPILEVLQEVDPTFRQIPNLADPFATTAYRNQARYKVEFLTPNRGSDDHLGAPASMPALTDTAARPLRHLDYLIHEPERSVLLHGGGVPVTVPRAERFAVHKLIVAAIRDNQAKANKDVMQAAALINVLAARRPLELTDAWRSAWATGPRWREKLERGRARLPAEAEEALATALGRGEEP